MLIFFSSQQVSSNSMSSSSNPLQPLRKSVSTKSSVSISSLVDRFTSHRHTSDSNIIAGTPGRRSFNFKLKSFFTSSLKETPTMVRTSANGNVADPKKPMISTGVKLRKYELKDDELPNGKHKAKDDELPNGKYKATDELSIHHLLLGQNQQKLVPVREDRNGVKNQVSKNGPIPLGNGVMLRGIPKIRRPHYVASLPVIEKISQGTTVEANINPRHSLASVQESPHESFHNSKLEEFIKKQSEAQDPQDPLSTPTSRRLRRTQSCKSERTLNRLKKNPLAPEVATSPYKNYTLTTPRKRGIQKKKTQTKRRKSIHQNVVEAVEAEIILRHVEELKEQKNLEQDKAANGENK